MLFQALSFIRCDLLGYFWGPRNAQHCFHKLVVAASSLDTISAHERVHGTCFHTAGEPVLPCQREGPPPSEGSPWAMLLWSPSERALAMLQDSSAGCQVCGPGLLSPRPDSRARNTFS